MLIDFERKLFQIIKNTMIKKQIPTLELLSLKTNCKPDRIKRVLEYLEKKNYIKRDHEGRIIKFMEHNKDF